MKILSWNVNGVRACWTKGLCQTIERHTPQLVALQEIKAFKEQCPEIVEALKDFDQVWHSAERPGYSGVFTGICALTLSGPIPKSTRAKKESVRTQQGMGISLYDCEGRVLVTEFGRFYFVNFYVPNGAASEVRHIFKMNFLKDTLKFLKDLDKQKPVLMAGDFNIAHQAIDIHDPVGLADASGFRPEERAWIDALLQAGFVDVFRLFYPTLREKYSWWSYRQLSRQRNKGWRIDYFFVSDRFKHEVASIEMLESVLGSDHCPLLLELKS